MTMYCCIYIYIISTHATMIGVPMTMYCCIYIYNLYTCHNGRCANDHVLLYIYIYLYTCHNGRCANDHVLLYIYI